ncbi:MAG TPA: polyprenyl synthetase family protein [Candidatus Eremiobacteraceae bacterium]|nr:polyprenyl synthetase family protein [Candidatus Eremiobacteraceae bacterium]
MAYETVPRPTTGDLAIPPILVKHAQAVAESLQRSALPTASFTGGMIAYHMGWTDREGRPTASLPGKLIRPALCIWSCEACGGSAEEALPAANALEWVHNFTLVHDDIQDGDRERRGRETVWAIWGLAQGINAGDALFARAFATLAKEGSHPERRLHATRLIADAVLVVVEGQALDLRFEGKPDTTLRAYLRMIRAKTGALIGASLEAGAVMAGAGPEISTRLRHAGIALGTAFQIRDDWLGTWGDPATTGKSSSGDLGRCKLTYPVVAGYAAMRDADRTRLRELFAQASSGKSSNHPLQEIRTLLEAAGGAELTRAAPARYAAKASAIVQTCQLPHQQVQQFNEVAHYVANRCR